MPPITESQTRSLLLNSQDSSLKKLASNSGVVKSLANVLSASLEVCEAAKDGGPTGMALAMGEKFIATSEVASEATGSKLLEVSNFIASQGLKSMSLMKVANLSPGKAAATISITMAQKVVAAAGLAHIDDCKTAIASLALSGAAAPVACVGTLGVGCVAAAIAVAADSFNVYGQCVAEK